MITLSRCTRETVARCVGTYYATEDEAKIAAEVAVREAEDLERLGFDWGYQCPGAIRLTKGNEFHPGTYEVCAP